MEIATTLLENKIEFYMLK